MQERNTMNCSGVRILTISPGLGPVRPLLFAVVGVGGVVRRKGFPLLGPFGLPSWGGLPFLVSPSRWGTIFLFFFLVFGGRVRRRVIGR